MSSDKNVQKKEPVKIREKKLANGNVHLFLDIYYNGKRTREFLKLYLIPEKTPADKEQNRQTYNLAVSIRSKRQLELSRTEYDLPKPYAEETPFLSFYRSMCEERHKTPDSDGNWGNWHSCLKYLEIYADEKTTFKDINKEWVLGFKDFLNTVEKDSHKVTHKKDKSVFQGLSQNSKLSYFNKLRCCINKAFEDGVIQFNPMRGVEGFKQEEVERVYLTVEEIKSLTATPCMYPWLKRAFLFSCLTGLRKSDIEKLLWSEVQDFDGFTRIVFRQKKTKAQEYLDINEQAVQYMGERGKPTDRVFSSFKYSAWTILELKKWAFTAGITKNITFHTGRHTFATMMLSLGADIYTVSKLLGHKELATTQIYAKVLVKRKQDAVSLIPNLGEK